MKEREKDGEEDKSSSVMEQAHALFDKRDPQAFSGLEDGGVILAARWRCYVFDAGAAGAKDVVGEGKL